MACSAAHSELRARLTKHASVKNGFSAGGLLGELKKTLLERRKKCAVQCSNAALRFRNEVRDDDREQCRRRHAALKYQIEEMSRLLLAGSILRGAAGLGARQFYRQRVDIPAAEREVGHDGYDG